MPAKLKKFWKIGEEGDSLQKHLYKWIKNYIAITKSRGGGLFKV